MRRLILCAVVLLYGVAQAQAGYLANAGFETQTTIPSGLGAATAGEWRGDPTVIVTAQDGIVPPEGQRMLQFIGTYPTGTGGNDSAIWQIVDVRPYADYIIGGDVEMLVTAQFNRVAGDSETDTEFGFFLKTLNSMPDQYPGYSKMDTFFSDSDPGTWETHASSLKLPTDTKLLLIGVLAVENVFDDDEDPFDGHYADNVTLSLLGVPEPSSLALLTIGFVGLFGYGWRRRHVR